jgi:threonine-phosphate decarboxylase
MIEGHGDDGWKYKAALRADFSSNVYYGALDGGLREHLRGAIDAVTHYPEAGALTLQTAAAAALSVSRDSVLVTNGATEAIYLIAQAFRDELPGAFHGLLNGPLHGPSVTVVGPTFAEYEDACVLQGMEVRRVVWEELVAAPLEGLVFVCNPNNPTGRALAAEELVGLADRWSGALFVVDESYIDFTLAGSVLGAGRLNIVVLRSLTKSCRIPGLRIGFLVGPEAMIARVARYKMPWSVNRVAIEAGLYIFQHRKDFVVPVESLLAATAEWRRELAEATGWMVWDSDTHYFLMETPAAVTAARLKGHLVSRYGLLIRDAANFKGLGPHHFRVACQAPEQNSLLTKALLECSRDGI